MAKHVALADSKRQRASSWGVIAFRSKLKAEPRRKNQIDRFVKAYDIAVDSINKNGVQHYAALLTKYYGVDAQTVSNLPKLKYSHAMGASPARSQGWQMLTIEQVLQLCQKK